MEKTININLGGTLFQIDEEAYRILREYLQSITLKFKNVPGGNETIDDIESRIAEIFQSQKFTAGVINKENVEAMISIIGKPEDFDQDGNGEPVHVYTSYQRRKMYRNPDDKIIGGICGGIGTYLNTDPVWFRILFILFALTFGIGFLVYLALWIALPSAATESQKKEMYGSSYNLAISGGKEKKPYTATTDVGNAFNEVFRAIGKVLFVIVRIILIITGIALVLAGFMALISFVMVFIFKYPGAFSTDVVGMNISYLPDFLNYIVTPALVPWIKALIMLAVSIPLIVIIYCGVKMIFWFRVRDGVFLLTGLIIWVISTAALSILLFNEGISFSETAKSASQDYFEAVPDTLYIISDKRISDISVDNEIRIPDEEYDIFVSDENKQIYIRTYLDISPSEENSAWVTVKKRSAGRSKMDATEKTERLLYNYKITGDTLLMDEFFTYPEGTKWSFDGVGVIVHVPEGTVVYMDRTTEKQFHSEYDDDFITDSKNRYWMMTDDGLEYIESPGRTDR